MSSIIDSPGLQEFGLAHVSQEELTDAFPEFRPYLGHCRFTNCQHLREPGCEITTASSQAIHAERLRIYQKLSRELAATARVF